MTEVTTGDPRSRTASPERGSDNVTGGSPRRLGRQARRTHLRRAGWRRAACGTLLGLVTVAGLHVMLGQDPALTAATRDPLAVAQTGDPLPLYTGWLSHVGVLGWALAASVLALAAGWSVVRQRRRGLLLLGGGACLSAFLCVDDLAMLHESVIPVLTGVGEAHTMVGLAGVASAWGLASLRGLVSGSGFAALVVSSVFLGASVLVDLELWSAVPEEGLELAGIGCWVIWAWSTAWESLDHERSTCDSTARARTGRAVPDAPSVGLP